MESALKGLLEMGGVVEYSLLPTRALQGTGKGRGKSPRFFEAVSLSLVG